MNLIYDCEIFRMIPPKSTQNFNSFELVSDYDFQDAYYKRFGDGLEYCSGWDDFSQMGISVIAVEDLNSDYSEVFELNLRSSSDGIVLESLSCVSDEPLLGNFEVARRFQELILTNTVYGFNSCKFDDELCQAHGLLVRSDYDLLEQVRLAAYGSINWYDCPRGRTYKLEALAQANGLGGKSGSGELVPKLWQQGKFQEVIDYCARDVQLTKQLILKFLANQLVDPNTGLLLEPVYLDGRSVFSRTVVIDHTSVLSSEF